MPHAFHVFIITFKYCQIIYNSQHADSDIYSYKFYLGRRPAHYRFLHIFLANTFFMIKIMYAYKICVLVIFLEISLAYFGPLGLSLLDFCASPPPLEKNFTAPVKLTLVIEIGPTL